MASCTQAHPVSLSRWLGVCRNEKELDMDYHKRFEQETNYASFERTPQEYIKDYIKAYIQWLEKTVEQNAKGNQLNMEKHQLKYSVWSAKVSWCPICTRHFYSETNVEHTTRATDKHFHILPEQNENQNGNTPNEARISGGSRKPVFGLLTGFRPLDPQVRQRKRSAPRFG